MNFPIVELDKSDFSPLLLEIPQPPKKLNYRGRLPDQNIKLLTVIGSRKYTEYGKEVVNHLISGLRGYNIGIVSGLALGIDSLAHEAALANNLYTLAIPGGGLSDEVIYPASHKPLAKRVLESGGGLLSEYEPSFRATKWSFPARNRLVAGIAHATLIIEASEMSGSLITARMCADYNRELMVVPGSIFSDTSKGTHQFLKLGATPVTEASDILNVLGLEVKNISQPSLPIGLSKEEEMFMKLLSKPTDHKELIKLSELPSSAARIVLTRMEMNGHIVETNGIYRKV